MTRIAVVLPRQWPGPNSASSWSADVPIIRMMVSAKRRERGRGGWPVLIALVGLVGSVVPGVRPAVAAPTPPALPTPTITTVAGGLAQLPAGVSPSAMTYLAVSGSTLYATDYTFTVVRAIDLSTATVRVVAGIGSRNSFYGDGGPATAAGFGYLTGIAVDRVGNLYIADRGNGRVRKVTLAGTVSTVAGTGVLGPAGDGGPATSAALDPDAVAVDAQGNLYVAGDGRVRKVDATGRIETVAGGGRLPLYDGQAARDGSLSAPADMSFDDSGNLYVADVNSGRVWRIGTDGIAHDVVNTIGTNGDWTYPTAVRARPDGTVLVAAQNRILAVDPQGHTTVLVGDGTYGDGGDAGPAIAAQLLSPTSIALDAGGNLYIADGSIRRVDNGGRITSLFPTDRSVSYWEGKAATATEMPAVLATAAGPDGTVYVAQGDLGHLWKVDALGVIRTVAGGGQSVPADGLPATSADIWPSALAVSPTGTVYFADSGQVFRIDQAGILRLVAGMRNVPCYASTDCAKGDGGPATAAQFFWPTGLAVAADGTVYVSDPTTNRVRRVDPSGIVTTVAGMSVMGYSGDGGPAVAAALFAPYTVALDTWGNLYVGDGGNGRVRKIDTAGIITTLAGTGTNISSGDGGPAVSAGLTGAQGVAVDPRGDVFVTDGNTIRKVDLDGRISTVAGAGPPGFWGDGGPARSAGLDNPIGLAVDPAGGLLVADSFNHRSRGARRSPGLGLERPRTGGRERRCAGGCSDALGRAERVPRSCGRPASQPGPARRRQCVDVGLERPRPARGRRDRGPGEPGTHRRTVVHRRDATGCRRLSQRGAEVGRDCVDVGVQRARTGGRRVHRRPARPGSRPWPYQGRRGGRRRVPYGGAEVGWHRVDLGVERRRPARRRHGD
jgi:sugar lactone lactonase YvrE